MTKSILALGAIVVAAVGLIFVLIFGMYLLSTYNNQADLNNRYEMKVVDDNNEFDNMWKQVSQSYQIADANKNAFKEIFASWAQGSTPQDGGKVMLWIKQAVPDTKGVADIYKDVMNVMTSKRDGFTMRQKELIAIAEQYNRNLAIQPRGFFLKLFGFKHIDPKIVTSTRTKKAFETGVDDDVSLGGTGSTTSTNK